MYLIAGLGNPGKQYEATRHNMGFDTVDCLVEKHNIPQGGVKFNAMYGKGIIGGEKAILMKPLSYMNLSGGPVRQMADYFKIDPETELIVIYDDIDIPTGTIRMRKKGSAGTHNGMRNIVYLLADDGFPRIRVGIGSDKKVDLINYVTGGVTKGEKELLEGALVKAADAAAAIVEKGIEKAMNEYNVKPKKEKEEND